MVATTKKMGPSQAPVCEAFIMTGETILKTYTNKSETQSGTTKQTSNSKQTNKTVQAADTTTPGLNHATPLPQPPPATTAAQSDTTPLKPPPIIARTTIATKSDCTNTNLNNNNNEGDPKDYLKHAQYRVAAALEQRAKSVSLGKLSDVNYQHHRLTTNGVDPINCWPAASKRATIIDNEVKAAIGLGGDIATREPLCPQEAGASARVRFPVHEHQEQLEQQQQQQQRREQEQEQERQQKHLHEHNVGGREENSRELGRRLNLDGAAKLQLETKQLKDCEYHISKQVDFSMNYKQQHKAQREKLKHQATQMDQRTPAPVTRTATFIVTPRQQKQLQLQRQDQSKLNGGQRFDEDDFSIQFKTGFLNRKRIFDARGKPTGKGRRGWRRVYVILRDLRFIVRHNYIESDYGDDQENRADQRHEANENSGTSDRGSPPAADQKMEEQSAKTRKRLAARDLKNTIRLHHSFAKRSTTYTKREYVFHLYLADQSELLLQANSESEMNAWIDTINFASACLSSPPLPNAVSSSSKRYHQHHQRSRPILPASYTKLSYWEQLTDHEERLERLKAELEELLNEAPVKSKADKRSKSEFIDKIAYLRQSIEHYTVYLDLMQKKSNSPEAIVLSKHPQIASLTPSKEMVRVLPLNVKAHEAEDKKDTN